MLGPSRPSGDCPAFALAWFMHAHMPAQMGEAKLVPPAAPRVCTPPDL
jgi:hypothetical protein